MSLPNAEDFRRLRDDLNRLAAEAVRLGQQIAQAESALLARKSATPPDAASSADATDVAASHAEPSQTPSSFDADDIPIAALVDEPLETMPLETMPLPTIRAELLPPAPLTPASLTPTLRPAVSAPRRAPAAPLSQPGLADVDWPTTASKSKPTAKAATDWETVIGGRWLTWIGAFVLILAMAFSIHWAWTTLATPPWVRVAAFHLLGVGLLAGGHLLQRRDLSVFAQAVAGLGLCTLYAAGFAALHLYELWSESVAFVEGVAITALAIGVALRARSAAVILIGALGGYATPIIASTGSGNHVVWFTYLAMLNVALVASGVLRPWSFLKPLALVATAAMFGVWVNTDHFTLARDEKLWSTEWLLALHAAIFLAGTTLPPIAWRRPSTRFDLSALGANSMWFVGMTWALFHDRPQQQMALVSWGMAALHLGLFAATYARVTNVDRMPRIHLALFAVFLTLAAPLQLDDAAYWSGAWCVEGLVFTAVGIYFRDRQMRITALCVFALAAARLAAFDYVSDPRILGATGVDLRFVMFTVGGLMAMAAGAMHWWIPRVVGGPAANSESGSPPGVFEATSAAALVAIGNIVVLCGLTLQWDGRIVLLLWTLDAAAAWAVGFRLDRADVRAYALVLGVGFAGGRALVDGLGMRDAHTLAANWRFVTLGALAAMYFVVGWKYFHLPRRQRAGRRTTVDELFEIEPGIHVLLGILANFALVVALSCEWHDAYLAAHGAADRSSSYDAIALLSSLGITSQTAAQVGYSVLWSLVATLLMGVAAAVRYPLHRVIALVGLAAIMFKLVMVDYRLAPATLGESSVDVRFAGMLTSCMLAVISAVVYGRAARGETAADRARQDAWIPPCLLAAAANVVGMLSLTCQWDGRLVLVLWTLDAAVVWAIGFYCNLAPVRWYAVALAVLAVGGRAVYHADGLDATFQLLVNERFGSLALVAGLYFAAGWRYRQRRLAVAEPTSGDSSPADSIASKSGRAAEIGVDWDEAWLDPALGILANGVLLLAITWEIGDWYRAAEAIGYAPLADMQMAKLATYSIVWALYAAAVVAAGFLLRYPLFRLLGLVGFLPIVGKVFLIDLESLELLPRVLAFAVLGVTLLGVSFLYQRFRTRIDAP